LECAKSLKMLQMYGGVRAWMGHSVPSRRARDNLAHTEWAVEGRV